MVMFHYYVSLPEGNYPRIISKIIPSGTVPTPVTKRSRCFLQRPVLGWLQAQRNTSQTRRAECSLESRFCFGKKNTLMFHVNYGKMTTRLIHTHRIHGTILYILYIHLYQWLMFDVRKYTIHLHIFFWFFTDWDPIGFITMFCHHVGENIVFLLPSITHTNPSRNMSESMSWWPTQETVDLLKRWFSFHWHGRIPGPVEVDK